MNLKDWLLPWRAKAKIEELQACLNRSVDAAPFTAKINLLEDRLEQTIKSLKAALDEKHACATLLSSTRASEQDWRETASKVDLEKNELASLNRTLVDQLEHAKADVEEWKGRVKVERKEREDVEKAIGGMKAEVLEAHTLAAKASKLQEALDHEIAEHRLAKEQVVGLTKWIRVAHRLDSPSPKGTIRRILQSARFRTTSRSGTVTAMALLCFAWTALGQAPFWRNPWSTNQAPPVIGTNLWISNTASGDGWFFFNQPNSNVVARLRDITAATASGTNFNGINVTNRALIGDLVVTNSGNTTNLTNWDMQTWKVKNNLGAFDNLELDVSSGLAQPSWTLGYGNSEPTILGQVLVGNGNDVNGGNSTVVGISNYVSNTKTHIVVGSFDQAWGGQDGVVGHDSLVTNAYNFAFGNHITNITTESVEIGPSDSNKVRISWLGLDALNLPMVSTNTTNFGALVFPPSATALSTNEALGTWTVSGSNGVLNILSPVGGAGLMGVQVKTNDGGTLVAQTLNASLGTLKFDTLGSEKMRLTSVGRLGLGTNVPSYTLHLNGTEAIGGFFNGAVTNPLQLTFIEYASVTNWPDIVMNGPSSFLGIGPGLISGNNLRIGCCNGPGSYWPTWGTIPLNLILDGILGVGTNNPQAALHVWGTTSPYLMQLGGPSGGTNVFSVTTNGTVSCAAGFTAGSTIIAGGSLVAGSGYPLGWLSSTSARTPTNGTLKISDSAGTQTGVANGATLLFDPVAALPFPAASKGVLTNGQWGIANTNGRMTFITSTNGTNLNQAFGITPSNIWVQTQQMTNNSPNSLPGQPIACYGAMMFNTTNYGQAFGTTAYTNIVGFNIWNTNQFNVNTNTGYLTNKFAGYYRCSINISMVGVNSGIYEGCMLTNDVDSELIGFQHQHDNPARWRSASGMGVIYLPANTGCSFALKCDTAGAIQIKRGSITIGTP